MTSDLTKEQREAQWWADWWAEDYTWEGLTRKPLQGWVVADGHLREKDTGRLYGQSPLEFPAAVDGRLANLQHYWRADAASGRLRTDAEMGDELIVSDGQHCFHAVHLPVVYEDGAPTAKIGWKADALDELIASRRAAAFETNLEGDFFLPVFKGPDGRMRLDGAVLEGGLAHLDAPSPTFNISCYRTAFLGKASFESAMFASYADFTSCMFLADARFNGAVFSKKASFEHAAFYGETTFAVTKFSGEAIFVGTNFSGPAMFISPVFESAALFNHARFSDESRFEMAKFSQVANFERVVFAGVSNFESAEFLGSVRFVVTKFQESAKFDKATFSSDANFFGAVFAQDVSFGQSAFKQGVSFDLVNFSGAAEFEKVDFCSHASFFNTVFLKSGRFVEATFSGTARFLDAKWKGSAYFNQANFEGAAEFQRCAFSEYLRFNNARFHDVMDFADAEIQKLASFENISWPPNARSWHSAFDQTLFRGTLNLFGAGFKAFAAFDGAALERGLQFDDTDERTAQIVFNKECRAAIIAALDDAQEFERTENEKRQKSAKKENSSPDRLKNSEVRAVFARQRESRLRELERGCRVLKQAMEKSSNKSREQLFYRFELQARRAQKNLPLGEKTFSYLYAASSDYGASMWRPFAALAVMIAAFAGLFYIWGFGFDAAALRADGWNGLFQALDLSWSNVFKPLSALSTENDFRDKNALAFRLLYNDAGGVDGQGFAVRAVSTLQSLLAIVLAFLFALAVRRRFQIS